MIYVIWIALGKEVKIWTRLKKKEKAKRQNSFAAKRINLRLLLAAIEAAVAYSKEVIEADLEKPGDDDVVGKMLRDCKEKSLDLDESKIREQLDFFGSEALKQIESDS